jgi:branched-chain amino acid transport system substrate-binding protein
LNSEQTNPQRRGQRSIDVLQLTVSALTLSALLPLAAAAQAKEAIQIGAVSSVSGVFAQQGEEVLRGIQFAVDEANVKGGVDGRKVMLKIADDESTPEAGRRAAEKMARDGNKLLIGPIASSITLAIGQNLQRWDALLAVVASKSDKITGDACKPRMFRTNHSDAMDLSMVGGWIKEVKENKFGVIATDYVWGRDSSEVFTRSAKAQGKTVSTALYPPMGTKDFSPYIAQLKAAGVDGVWVALVGRDAIAFAKQAQEFGLSSKRILGHAYIMNFLVSATGNATQGVWGNIGYGPEIETPLNKAYVTAWRSKFGRVPTDNEGQAYNGVQAIFEGVRKAGSVKPGDVAAALKGATYDSVYGPVTMRAADNQLVLPNYVGQVKLVDGKLRPVIEERFGKEFTPAASALCKL